MSFFRDFFRDLSETPQEHYLRLAREAEASGRWGEAGRYYNEAGAWEEAAAAYLRNLKDHRGDLWTARQAAACYFKTGNYEKVLEVLVAAVQHNELSQDMANEIVNGFREAHRLPAVVKAIEAARPALTSDQAHHGVAWLAEALHRAGEPKAAAQIVCLFSDALSYQAHDIAGALLQSGDSEEALKFYLTLKADGIGLDCGRLLQAGLQARAADFVSQVAIDYLITREPLYDPGLRDKVSALSQWELVLEQAALQNPAAVARMLAYRLEEVGTPSEAEILERCCALIRERPPGQVSRQWVHVLAEFWRKHGNLRRAADLHVDAAATLPERGFDFRASDFERAALCFAEIGATLEAARAFEAAANLEPESSRSFDQEFAASLYRRAGAYDRASELYRAAGRPARADRCLGQSRYALSEARLLPWSGQVENLEVNRRYVRDPLHGSLYRMATEAYQKGDIAAAVQALWDELWPRAHANEDWYWIPEIYKRAGDLEGYRAALLQVEQKLRERGDWMVAALMYLYDEQYGEFDRVCTEEDELEFAVLWYEKNGMLDGAARIYHLMSEETVAEAPRTKGVDAPDSCEIPSGPEASRVRQCTSGHPLQADWIFCPKCGAGAELLCPSGHGIEAGWEYCPKCGTRVKA